MTRSRLNTVERHRLSLRVTHTNFEPLEGRRLLASTPFDVPVVPTGQTAFTLYPIESVAPNQQTRVSFGVPFPKGFVTDLSKVRLLGAGGAEAPVSIQELTPWRDLSTLTNLNSVRSALVQTDVSFPDTDGNGRADPLSLNIEWGMTARTQQALAPVSVRSTWVAVNDADFPASHGVYEPRAYALFSADWYGQSMLKSRLQPFGTENDPNFASYENYFLNFGRTAVNDVDPRVTEANKVHYLTDFDPWLFDRATTLYQLAFRSGRVDFLREAHRAAQFYANHISADGHFDMRAGDMKYVYGEGISSNYWLTGDDRLPAVQRRMIPAFDGFNATYTASTGFWTERHAAFKLLGYTTGFELLGDAAIGQKAQNTFNAYFNMQSNPVGGAPNNGLLMHTSASHGEGGGELVASPWMSVLLVDAVERYYVHSGDARVKQFVTRMADGINRVGESMYTGTFNGRSVLVPYYLAGPNLTADQHMQDIAGDVEHAADVSKVFALAYFFSRADGAPNATYLGRFNDLTNSADAAFDYWYRPSGPASGLTEYRLTPPRKFNWWFRTTADNDYLAAGDIGAPPPPPPTQGVVQFGSASYTAGEAAGTFNITVARTGNTSGAATVAYSTSNGTAAAGSDYTAASGTLSFAAGEASKTFAVSILNDTLVEGDETVNLSLANPTGATLGANSSAVLTIRSDDTAPPPTDPIAYFSFNEGAGATAGGGSVSGAISGATWAAGRYGNALRFDGVNDMVTVADNAALRLANAVTVEAWVNPTSNGAWDTVVMKERAGGLSYALYGSTSLSQPSATVNNGGTRDLHAFGPTLPLNVWSHLALTYDGQTLRLYVNGTEAASQPVAAPLATGAGILGIGGSTVWSDEYFGGLIDEVYVYGRALTPAEVQRDMNAGTPTPPVPPVVQLSSATYSVTEGTAAVNLIVTRTGDASVQSTVNYATASGTATAGSDYTAASGTLTFAAGETSKTISVPILNDTQVEDPETFGVGLWSASGATIGSQSSASVTITSDDVPPPAPSASIAGTIFNDANGNRVRDAGEVGLSGRQAFLDADADGLLDAGERSVLTGSAGDFRFDALAAGTYRVAVTAQAGWLNTDPASAYRSVSVVDGQALSGVLFGQAQGVSIRGSVYNDRNANGVKNRNEGYLSSVRVFLDADNDGQLDAGEATTTTNSVGAYSFSGLAPGTYSVRVIPNSGWQNTVPSTGLRTVTLTGGQSATGLLFGLRRIV